MNKYWTFTRNATIGIVAAVSVGLGVAELTDLVTDNKKTISIASTISEYVAGYSAFLPLHAKSNKDIYRDEEGKFKTREFIQDQAKLAGAFFLLDIAYILGRSWLINEYLEEGYKAYQASAKADLISYVVIIAAAIPIAKLTGNIRKKRIKK